MIAVRVLLIGSTGVLGRQAVPRLLDAGHKVTGLARNDERAKVVAGLGIEPVVGALFDVDSMAKALDGQEAVLNLATRIPVTMRAMLRGMAENDRVRTEGSRVLVDAARESEVRVIVQEGISFVYADGGDRELDETAPVDALAQTKSSLVAQGNVLRHPGGVFLRIGMLMGGSAAAPPVFIGNGWMSAVHPADAAAAAIAALDAPPGIYNVGADPVLKREMKRPHLPQALARFAGVFGRSQRVVTHKLTEATGWRPRYRATELL
jgi:nucleoside-diphosphate-sugar epimerase